MINSITLLFEWPIIKYNFSRIPKFWKDHAWPGIWWYHSKEMVPQLVHVKCKQGYSLNQPFNVPNSWYRQKRPNSVILFWCLMCMFNVTIRLDHKHIRQLHLIQENLVSCFRLQQTGEHSYRTGWKGNDRNINH